MAINWRTISLLSLVVLVGLYLGLGINSYLFESDQKNLRHKSNITPTNKKSQTDEVKSTRTDVIDQTAEEDFRSDTEQMRKSPNKSDERSEEKSKHRKQFKKTVRDIIEAEQNRSDSDQAKIKELKNIIRKMENDTEEVTIKEPMGRVEISENGRIRKADE